MGISSWPRLRRLFICGAILLCANRLAIADDGPEPTAEEIAERIFTDASDVSKSKLLLDRSLELSAGKLVAWDLSADATRALITDDRHHLAVWDISGEPKKLWEIEPPLLGEGSRFAISRDGKQALHGSMSGKVEVYDATTGELLFTHVQQDLKNPIIRVGFSCDGKRIFALDKFGLSLTAPSTEKGKVQTGKRNPNGEPGEHILMDLVGENFAWKTIYIDGKTKHYFQVGDRLVTNLSSIFPDALPELHTMSAGPTQFLVGRSPKFAVVTPSIRNDLPHLQVNLGHSLRGDNGADFSSDGKWIWLRGIASIDVAHGTKGELVGTVDIPIELFNSSYRCFPDAQRICRQTDQGLEIWKVAGNPVQVQMRTNYAITELLDNQRFDAIEALAKKWDGLTDHFIPQEHETPTTFLINRLQSHKLPDETDEQRNERYVKWIEEHPDNCQFLRITMFRIYQATGYRARGPGFANTVTEEGWTIFYENMAKMWKVIEPIYDDEHVPAEAYTCAIIAGKNLQWDRDEVNGYLRKSFDKWPNYHRTYAEEAVARLPRWGGAPEDTAAFAEKLANRIGGDDGEIMYAQLGRHVARFEGLTTLTLHTGMSPSRMMRGMVLLSQQTDDTLLWNRALLFAATHEDKEAMRQVCQLFVATNTAINKEIWPGKHEMLDKVYEEMRAAKAGDAEGEGGAK